MYEEVDEEDFLKSLMSASKREFKNIDYEQTHSLAQKSPNFYSFEKVYENEETSNRVTTNSSIQDELDSSSSKELKSSIFTEQQNLVNQTTQTKKRVALLIPDNEA